MPPDDVRRRLLEGLGAETLIVVLPLRMEGTVHCLTMQIPADPDAIPQGAI